MEHVLRALPIGLLLSTVDDAGAFANNLLALLYDGGLFVRCLANESVIDHWMSLVAMLPSCCSVCVVLVLAVLLACVVAIGVLAFLASSTLADEKARLRASPPPPRYIARLFCDKPTRLCARCSDRSEAREQDPILLDRGLWWVYTNDLCAECMAHRLNKMGIKRVEYNTGEQESIERLGKEHLDAMLLASPRTRVK
jgi:hypothetical protein